MRISSLIGGPATFVLVLASTAGFAQDKPSPTTASKPVTTLSKGAKHTTKPVIVQQDTMANTAKERTKKEGAPSTTQSAPVSERSHEGCHHAKDSDA